MSLLGVDVGTTGTKAVVFGADGSVLGSAYTEYDIARSLPGRAELDPLAIWPRIRAAIAGAVDRATRAGRGDDPVRGIAVDSMGENLVPVSGNRTILGPSIMNMDERGSEFIPALRQSLSAEDLYTITGNTLSNQFSIGKLMWMCRHEPDLYDRTDWFLPWNSFVSFMLGGEAVAEFSLASRTLLFDIDRQDWSESMVRIAGLDGAKLPRCVPAGTVIGGVSRSEADAIGIAAGTPIVIGAHDQPSASLGSGAIAEGVAMYGMGTFHCIAPTFSQRRPADDMMRLGLNTEHHALRRLYLTLVYNSGGSAVKWYRDTFAHAEVQAAQASGGDVYDTLFSELPAQPSHVRVIPHFATMGPPDFVDRPNAAFLGMTLNTTRAEILKGIVEGNVFSLRLSLDALPSIGISISELRPTGGGSRSIAAVQACVDILGIPAVLPEASEASALGGAILAGVGAGVFASAEDGAHAMIRTGTAIEPDMSRHNAYEEPYEEFKRLRAFVVESRSQ